MINELSTDTLASYKKKAGAEASEIDKKPTFTTADSKQYNKRFSGIVKATKKQFDNDKKKTNESEELDENSLTPAETAKREEIVKSLKSKRADFVKRYGKEKAKSVMYATATKVAKEVAESTEELDESDSAIDGAEKGPISQASAKHGRVKPMSGTKTIASKIATILTKKV